MIDAFTTDSILLENFAGQYPVLKVIGNHFSQEPYGIAVPKGEVKFQNLIKFYGDPLLWEFLFEANQAVLDDPDQLKVGDVLTIPAL